MENIYGHTKKLEYFRAVVRVYAQSRRLPLADLRLLDLGCGNGQEVTAPLGALGSHVLGVDLHRESLDYAQSRVRLPNVRFRLGDERCLTEYPGAFDMVVLSDVLEHVHRPDRLLNAVRGSLRPEGRLVLSVPNGYGPFEMESAVLRVPVVGRVVHALLARIQRALGRLRQAPPRRLAVRAPYNHESGHVQFFTVRSLRGLLSECGFSIVEWRNGAALGATGSDRVLQFWPLFLRYNTQVADRLPRWMVSTWYLTCAPFHRPLKRSDRAEPGGMPLE